MSDYGDTVEVCPHCDSTDIYPRRQQSSDVEGGKKWRCGDCCSRFEEPAVRERRSPGSLSGTAALLDEMDPDEIGGNPA